MGKLKMAHMEGRKVHEGDRKVRGEDKRAPVHMEDMTALACR